LTPQTGEPAFGKPFSCSGPHGRVRVPRGALPP
jgi:hypothetical protein